MHDYHAMFLGEVPDWVGQYQSILDAFPKEISEEDYLLDGQPWPMEAAELLEVVMESDTWSSQNRNNRVPCCKDNFENKKEN